MFSVKTRAPDHIRAIEPRAGECHFFTYDDPAELMRHAAQTVSVFATPKVVKDATDGDLSLVAASDEFLKKFENCELASVGRVWVDDVCGSVANVPAYIAGQPLSMKRRHVRREASAPIALVFELTCSRAIADGSTARGACYLALARLLSAKRPVELYLSATYLRIDCNGMGATFFRIPTDPLNVAVAANALLSEPFLIALSKHCLSVTHSVGAWAFGSPLLERLKPEITYAPALPHIPELVVFPAAHSNDALSRDPFAWVSDQFKRLSGEAEDAA